ncbi:unnamed protein product [Meloidogyne enterolobii]|uniref:Uncharacterized protein n=1 Tax=Meloidogyne enterolobii TaxID=390850 RepID=A0ACB0YB07_MELEN
MNAEYPLGTNPSGQESSQNWLNLGLNPEMNTYNQTGNYHTMSDYLLDNFSIIYLIIFINYLIIILNLSTF